MELHFTTQNRGCLDWLIVSAALTELTEHLVYFIVYFQFRSLGRTTPKCMLKQHPPPQNITNPLSALLLQHPLSHHPCPIPLPWFSIVILKTNAYQCWVGAYVLAQIISPLKLCTTFQEAEFAIRFQSRKADNKFWCPSKSSCLLCNERVTVTETISGWADFKCRVKKRKEN